MSSEHTPLLWNKNIAQSGTIGKDKHTQFCTLTGCPPSHAPPDYKHHTSKNSLYGRASAARNSQNVTYLFTATLTNTLLLSQVVLGAALTGLGASKQPYILVTLFGALNTVIAGLVAYLKSRGQPMRSRMYRDDLDRVVDEMENSEVMWLGISNGVHGYDDLNDSEVTVRSEVARLTRLYDRAVRNNTMNNPDMYAAGGAMDGSGGGGGSGSGNRGGRPTGTGGALPAVVAGPVEDAAPAAKPDTPESVPPGATSAPAAQNPVAIAPVATDPDVSPASAPPKKEAKKEEEPKKNAADAGATGSGSGSSTREASDSSGNDSKTATSPSSDVKKETSTSTSTPTPVVAATAAAAAAAVDEDEDASPATRPRIASRHASKVEGAPKKVEGEDE